MPAFRLPAPLLALWLCACGAAQPDAAAPADASTPADASLPDAGDGADAGEQADAGAPADAGEDRFPERCPEAACGDDTPVADAAAFVAEAASLDWHQFGFYTSGCLAPSRGLIASAATEVAAAQVAIEPGCLGADDCRHVATFVVPDGLTGVGCAEADPDVSWGCARLALAEGARFRLRLLVKDRHPWIWTFVPAVELLPPCDAPCGEGQLRCEANGSCWNNTREHCSYCLGAEVERCACWDGAAWLADGTACSYSVSQDSRCRGECAAGLCAPAAGQTGCQ